MVLINVNKYEYSVVFGAVGVVVYFNELCFVNSGIVNMCQFAVYKALLSYAKNIQL